ncbi:MAG: hypothetical protein DYG83_02455 [Candidatus Brocadia sp. AMX2]|uniref:HEPN domain-containing protein n=1 Tax=Candidatus Brocadia sinica JPN1 TaxID=1197129 RepID=A0ABQ0JWP2_9BACT|nr:MULTISPECIES: hypothetical protein [Brocadia]MBC6931011.1 hypothetical protein [Candidatus Brocadia sp.]MBL1168212.1 hypothetical protein [Candidatus Brocadia sp. AMX1]NOG40985.1 hypothetical protein [Planctomycetota bacterium]GIK13048.1 MAG: hypothetical protein BroJett002_17550 [Candidatus Brocadia sinica]KAA0244319.1 MAG: hypothetical protein EDM70_07175 [Candidatus Brocadia sp. AMX2]
MKNPNNCESSYKKALQKLQTANSCIDYANYGLNSGSMINWVCNEMGSALMWAMEAWLLAHGYSSDFSNWGSMRMQFREYAPETLWLKISNVLSELNFLDVVLLGDPYIDCLPRWPIEKWKSEAYICLSEVKVIISKINEDVISNKP